MGGTALASLLQSCSSGQYYASNEFTKDGIKVSKREFTHNKNGKGISRNYVFVKPEKLNFPIYLYKISENEYSALWMECSHQGAELSAHGEYLACPAHGSEFDKFGHVIQGPAINNLRTFKTVVDAQYIYIHLS